MLTDTDVPRDEGRLSGGDSLEAGSEALWEAPEHGGRRLQWKHWREVLSQLGTSRLAQDATGHINEFDIYPEQALGGLRVSW